LHRDDIEKFLLLKGYLLNSFVAESFGEINLELVNTYDLLLIDYHLDDDEISGHQVIDEIRKANCLTPVIFYSNSPTRELRGKIGELGLDGVYCSTRGRFQALVKQIISNSLRKVENVNNLRGLFLAISSDLEDSLNLVLLKIFDLLDGEKIDELIKYVADDKCQQALDKNNATLSSFRQKEIEFRELVSDHYFFDMCKKAETLQHYLKEEPISQKPGIKEIRTTHNGFIREIIQVRNSLAHVIEEIDAEGNVFLKGNNDVVYDDTKFVEIRINLRKHNDNLKKLIRIL